MIAFLGKTLRALLLSTCALGCGSKPEPVRESAFAAPLATQTSAPVDEPQAWWTSRSACLESLESKPPLPGPERVRLATWNVRYFPDGAHGEQQLHGGADVAWLACAIARLDPDVLAVQEFKAGERLQPALDELLQRLAVHTGSQWKFESAGCGESGDSHVGLLWNTSRATLRKTRMLPQTLLGRRCDDNVQPLLTGHFRFRSDLDFHVGVLHFVPGDREWGAALREKQRRALGSLAREVRKGSGDQDLVLTGDWNSSGCSAGCAELLSASDERRWLERTLRHQAGLTLVPPNLGCSDYYLGQPGLVDHFAVSASLRLPEGTVASVDGFCVEAACQKNQGESAAYRRLSDHCPLLLDIPLPRYGKSSRATNRSIEP